MSSIGGSTGVRWRPLLWAGAVVLLLAPLVAMQLTDEVQWTGSDFVVFGLLLATAGGAIEVAVRWTRDRRRRATAVIGVVAVFLLVWVELAVGIIGPG